jgi:uncharacterized protein YkwD
LIAPALLAAQEPPKQEPAAPAPAKETPTEQTETVEAPGEREGAAKPDLAAVVRGIVERTNAFRKEQRREPVQTDEKLAEAASDFARYMAKTDRYGHKADDRTPADRVAAAGYDPCVVEENIAYRFRETGFTTDDLAEGFVVGWEQSPPHRRNMLDRSVTVTGAGVAQSEKTGVYYAVQLFGRPKSAAIGFEVTNQSELTVAYRVGDRTFQLPPRVTRTHEECRPATVRFLPDDPGLRASHPSGTVARFTPKGGERMTVVPADKGYRVEIARREPPAENAAQGSEPIPQPRSK